jgi:hypothetical protein
MDIVDTRSYEVAGVEGLRAGANPFETAKS